MIKEEWQTAMVPVKKDHQPHYHSLFSSQLPLPFSETNSYCQSLRINKVYWQIADCVRKDKTVRGKYAKTELHLRQLCDPSETILVWGGAGCVKERTPQALRRGGPGGLGYAYTPMLHSQPFKMPYHHHTSVKIETECTICERKSTAFNVAWMIRLQVMPEVSRLI